MAELSITLHNDSLHPACQAGPEDKRAHLPASSHRFFPSQTRHGQDSLLRLKSRFILNQRMGLHKCLLESIIMYNEKFVPFAEIIFRPPLLPLGMIFLLLSYHKGSEQILIVPWRGTILLVSILLVPWKSCKCAILMLFPAGDKLENTRPALQWACARDPQNHHSRGPLALCSPSLPHPPPAKAVPGQMSPSPAPSNMAEGVGRFCLRGLPDSGSQQQGPSAVGRIPQACELLSGHGGRVSPALTRSPYCLYPRPLYVG